MANFIPDAYRNMLLGTGTRVDLDADTIKAMLVDHADDTPTTSDDFIDDIASAARIPAIGSCPTLGSKTVGSVAVGVFDAADTVFTSLTGDQAESLILFKDSGSEATSDIIARWDTATGLPITPNGANVTITWAAGGILTV
jgi:hypothetical protein